MLLERWGIADAYDDALRVWLTIEPVAETRELVAGPAGGRGPLLPGDQPGRAPRPAHAGEPRATPSCSTTTFYSYELGWRSRTRRTSPRSWTGSACPPDEVLFVDDNAANVEAARAVGLRAEQWHVDDGVDALRDQLARARPARLSGAGGRVPEASSTGRAGRGRRLLAGSAQHAAVTGAFLETVVERPCAATLLRRARR